MTAGTATVRYPFVPHPPEAGFRGRVVVDTERCVGCAGCADVCPSREHEPLGSWEQRAVHVRARIESRGQAGEGAKPA